MVVSPTRQPHFTLKFLIVTLLFLENHTTAIPPTARSSLEFLAEILHTFLIAAVPHPPHHFAVNHFQNNR
jgi:hypothetical protein